MLSGGDKRLGALQQHASSPWSPPPPAPAPLSADTDDGASLDTVFARLRGTGFTRAQLEAAVQTLTTDGFIYSTVDEQHYRATS